MYKLEDAFDIVRLYSGFMLETITLGNNPKNKAATPNAIEIPLVIIAILAFFKPIKYQLNIKANNETDADNNANLL